MLLEMVQAGMTEKALRKAFYESLPNVDSEARKKAFYRARDAVIAAGFIEIATDKHDGERRVIVLKEIR